MTKESSTFRASGQCVARGEQWPREQSMKRALGVLGIQRYRSVYRHRRFTRKYLAPAVDTVRNRKPLFQNPRDPQLDPH